MQRCYERAKRRREEAHADLDRQLDLAYRPAPDAVVDTDDDGDDDWLPWSLMSEEQRRALERQECLAELAVNPRNALAAYRLRHR